MNEQGTMLVDETIREFEGEYRFLSNFLRQPVEVPTRRIWAEHLTPVLMGASVEHVYQAMKVDWRDRTASTTLGEVRWVLDQPGPGKAKQAGSAKGLDGRTIRLRPDWEQIKVPVMLACLRAKFDLRVGSDGESIDKALATALMGTSPRVLVEGNTWGDDYWGVLDSGRGKGKNMLGRLLMLVRAELLVAAAAGIDAGRLRAHG